MPIVLRGTWRPWKGRMGVLGREAGHGDGKSLPGGGRPSCDRNAVEEIPRSPNGATWESGRRVGSMRVIGLDVTDLRAGEGWPASCNVAAMATKATENRQRSRRCTLELVFIFGVLTLLAWFSAAIAQEVGSSRVESTDAIRVTAESFVKAQLPGDANVASVTAGTLDPRLRLVHCSGGMHGQLPAGAQLLSRTMVGVACDGPVHWVVYVPVTVESRISVLVLKHPVPRDARLTSADVTVETRKVTGLATAFLTDVTDLLARTTARPLPVGTTLTIDMLKADLVIKHGQDVTLIASAGGIEVRAAGRALSDAAGGSRVKVQNLSSLKVVEGVVEGPDTVRVAQ
jgi:flagellar basal body P-ring formation protein FlgA